MRIYRKPSARIIVIDAAYNLMEGSYFVDGPDTGDKPTGHFDTRKQRTIWECWNEDDN